MLRVRVSEVRTSSNSGYPSQYTTDAHGPAMLAREKKTDTRKLSDSVDTMKDTRNTNTTLKSAFGNSLPNCTPSKDKMRQCFRFVNCQFDCTFV